MKRRSQERGFTLLEVVVALGILAISLVVLIDAQVSSLNNAGRARLITIASLLARSKMIDLEQQLFDEGFTAGEQTEEGDFGDEGHPEVKWAAKIKEVELDLSTLGSLCGEAGDEASLGCEGMLSGMGGMLEGITGQIANSIRLVDLTVTWPDGRYTESMKVSALVSKDDAGTGGGAPAPGTNPGALPGGQPPGGVLAPPQTGKP